MKTLSDSADLNTGANSLCEYRLVLHPHEDLWNRVLKIKNEFADKFDCASARFGKPQITLVNFSQQQPWEQRIQHRLYLIALAQPPMQIELQDFGNYPTHTIFFQVKNKTGIQTLVKQIRTEAGRLLKHDDQHKPHYILDPHITLAAKLKPWQYEKGWFEFSQRHFSGRFVAKDMLLLRKRSGEAAFSVVQQFLFQNLPVSTKQGLLFSTVDAR